MQRNNEIDTAPRLNPLDVGIDFAIGSTAITSVILVANGIAHKSMDNIVAGVSIFSLDVSVTALRHIINRTAERNARIASIEERLQSGQQG